MDASSIITQVSRDDEQLSNFSPEKVQLPRVENELSLPGQASKKPRRGLLRTLLCCFSRPPGPKGSKGSYGGEGRCSPPLSPGSPRYLLPSVRHQDMHKKCMVIDLDETLVHSSFKPINNADFVVPVEIDGTVHQVYVLKRPYVDEFLQRMGELYECVLFTASLAKYADPVANLLDRWSVFQARLFRESCVFHRGNYVKDLNKLGRDLQKVVIVDNSPASYIFHPDNAVPVASWFDDMTDSELLDLIPFFEKLSKVDNVYTVLCNSNHPYNTSTVTTVTTASLQPQQLQQHANLQRSEMDETDIEDHEPEPSGTSAVLNYCKKKILHPYLQLLSVMGLRPIRQELPDNCRCNSVLYYIHFIFVLMLLIIGYILQGMACFRRDRGFCYKATYKVPADTCQNICYGNVTFSYVVPSVLHFTAYLYAVYLFRVMENEQLQNLMERAFLMASNNADASVHQRHLMKRLWLFILLSLLWIALSVASLSVMMAKEKIIFVWFEERKLARFKNYWNI